MKSKVKISLGIAALTLAALVLLLQPQKSIQIISLGEIDTKKAKNISANIPSDILSGIKEERKLSEISEGSLADGFIKKYLYDYSTAPAPVDYIEVKEVKGRALEISKQSAIDDLNYLFNCLKYGYAGYQCFGGDDAFLRAKERIIDKIGLSNDDNISNSLFKLEIYKNLDFIQDGHFVVGDKNLVKRFNAFISDRYEFVIKEERFFLKEKNNLKQIVSINGQEPGEFIKLSINEDGYIVYRLCTLSQTEDKEITLDLKLEDRSIKTKLYNMRTNTALSSRNGMYSYKERNKVPIIKLSAFRPSKELERFVEEAKQMKNKDLLVIDLRSNSGGDASYPINWIKNFTGEDYEDSIISTNLSTELAKNALLYAIKQLYDEKYYPQYESIVNKDYSDSDSQNKYWSKVEAISAKRISNDIPIFVLMDKRTASAGEGFIRALKNMDNTFFIGSNTSGIGDFGNRATYILPNSGIKVEFGSSIFLDQDLIRRDGLGWEPDFWVDPKEAETRVLKFISIYSK